MRFLRNLKRANNVAVKPAVISGKLLINQQNSKLFSRNSIRAMNHKVKTGLLGATVLHVLDILIFVSIFCLAAASCDKVPGMLRKGNNFTRSQYFGYEADHKMDVESAYLAAKSYCCGPDTENDDIRALQLYCVGAKANHKGSMIEVANLYSHQSAFGPGTIVPYDKPLAYAYLFKAAEGNYTPAKQQRDDFVRQLTPPEKSRADQLIEAFPDVPCEITR